MLYKGRKNVKIINDESSISEMRIWFILQSNTKIAEIFGKVYPMTYHGDKQNKTDIIPLGWKLITPYFRSICR